MNRILVLNRPEQIPQKCSICGANTRDREYLDIGLHVERYGHVYFCSSCVKEIAEAVSYVPSFDLAVANDKIDIWRAHYLEAKSKVRELESVVSSLRNIDNSRLDSLNAVHVNVQDNERAAKEEGQSDPGPVESDSSEQPRDVPATKHATFSFDQ